MLFSQVFVVDLGLIRRDDAVRALTQTSCPPIVMQLTPRAGVDHSQPTKQSYRVCGNAATIGLPGEQPQNPSETDLNETRTDVLSS